MLSHPHRDLISLGEAISPVELDRTLEVVADKLQDSLPAGLRDSLSDSEVYLVLGGEIRFPYIDVENFVTVTEEVSDADSDSVILHSGDGLIVLDHKVDDVISINGAMTRSDKIGINHNTFCD